MPRATARRPEPHSWFMPQAGASTGMPALIEAWRAGFWPSAGGEDLAHDDFVDVFGFDVGAGERGLDGDLAEFMRRQARTARR